MAIAFGIYWMPIDWIRAKYSFIQDLIRLSHMLPFSSWRLHWITQKALWRAAETVARQRFMRLNHLHMMQRLGVFHSYPFPLQLWHNSYFLIVVGILLSRLNGAIVEKFLPPKSLWQTARVKLRYKVAITYIFSKKFCSAWSMFYSGWYPRKLDI
jgi:hypothetical protein